MLGALMSILLVDRSLPAGLTAEEAQRVRLIAQIEVADRHNATCHDGRA